MNYKHRYTKELLEPIVAKSSSVADVLRTLSIPLAGGNHSHISKKIKEWKLDTSHFVSSITKLTSAAKIANLAKRRKPEDILKVYSGNRREAGSILTRALVESGRKYNCVSCGISATYNNSPIVLEVDHINNDWLDNRAENLQFLCPNCHSQKTKADGSKKKSSHTQKREIKISDVDPNWRNRPRVKIRKVTRPSREELKALATEFPMTTLGKKFGVSDNAVRKWMKSYGLSITRKQKMVGVTGVEPAMFLT